MSFDKATIVDTDRYLTLSVHHSARITSKIAPLRLVRVNDHVTGEYLKTVIESRLENFGLTKEDFIAAATDGASNVLCAVDLMGLRKQECFARGLDLVVRKVVCGEKAKAFDVAMFFAVNSEETLDDEDSDTVEEVEEEQTFVKVLLG